MLKETLNQEKYIFLMFGVILIIIFNYLIVDKSNVDVIYLIIVGYYFYRFLGIKNRR